VVAVSFVDSITVKVRATGRVRMRLDPGGRRSTNFLRNRRELLRISILTR